MAEFILDTSALIAYMDEEAGADIVFNLLADSSLSLINYAETLEVMQRKGFPTVVVRTSIHDNVPDFIDFTSDIAELTAELAKDTRSSGLSLGDRACLATAIIHGLTVVTADKKWATISFPRKPKIKVIR